MNTKAWAGLSSPLGIKAKGRARIFWLAILVSACVIGCKKKKAPPPAPPEVMVITVEPRDVPIYKEWIGTLDGLVNAQIRAEVGGYLLSQNYAEGSRVNKGDLLFQIDPRPFEAQLE